MPLDQSDPLWFAIMALLKSLEPDTQSGLYSYQSIRKADELRLALWRDQQRVAREPVHPAALPSTPVPTGDHRSP